jgi:arylsulfatase A-like enzyme
MALLCFATALGACSPSPPSPPPNVLVISVDTLRPDHLACYGYSRATAPSIDRLAAQGVLFENAYATGPATIESHASLFTGRFPYQHGAFTGAWSPLPDEEVTLAELLGEHGYRTLGMASSLRFEPDSGFQQGFQDYGVTRRPKNECSRIVTDRALDWIGQDEAQPFFAFLHYFGPHEPYGPPEPYRSHWQTAPTASPGDAETYMREYRFPGREMPAEALAHLEALYDAEILFLDSELTRLLDALDQRGLASRTLVILLSDHGEEFKEHGGLSHAQSLHEELLRIPLLVRWPGRIPAGRRVTRSVQLVDVLPTVLDLVGAPPRDVPGRSLRPALFGTAESEADRNDPIIGQRFPSGWSITTTRPEGRFKLIAQGRYPARLFRLDDDPGEHRDVAREYPKVFTALTQLGRERPGLAREVKTPARDLPDDVRKRLEELGYLEEARSKPALQ